MYCIKCGVELADSEKRCPLCGTPVFHPDLPRNLTEPPYPADRHIRREDVNRSGILFVLTVVALLPAILSLLCDWRINGTIVWSGYAAGAIGLLYVMIVLPLWFRHPNPVIFVPVDFAAIGLYLLYIDFATGGHWFLSFAFPVTGAIGLLVTAVVVLTRYLHGGWLYIYGGAFTPRPASAPTTIRPAAAMAWTWSFPSTIRAAIPTMPASTRGCSSKSPTPSS